MSRRSRWAETSRGEYFDDIRWPERFADTSPCIVATPRNMSAPSAPMPATRKSATFSAARLAMRSSVGAHRRCRAAVVDRWEETATAGACKRRHDSDLIPQRVRPGQPINVDHILSVDCTVECEADAGYSRWHYRTHQVKVRAVSVRQHATRALRHPTSGHGHVLWFA